tara:strand:- start:680 stop:1384 length:705 start_codon:yes stop_codon:yes gene_type:complete
MTYPVAILAGGLATRMKPITESTPKSLIVVDGEPFIAKQLKYLKTQKVTQVVICTGHMGKKIQDVVGDGSLFGLQVHYSWDGTKLLGTGGALKKAQPLLGDKFFVIYGDSYLPIKFSSVEKAFSSSKKKALMVILENRDQWDKSNVLYQDGKLLAYNKHTNSRDMLFIDYGLAILRSDVFSDYNHSCPFGLETIYEQLARDRELEGFISYERFYEIGSHKGLVETEQYFKEGRN